MSAEKSDNALHFHAEKIDTHTLLKLETIDWAQALPPPGPAREETIWQASKPFLFTLFPNSVSVTRDSVTSKGDVKDRTWEGSGSLSGFSVGSVQHPEGFSPWDFAGEWKPSGSFQLRSITPRILPTDSLSNGSEGERNSAEKPLGGMEATSQIAAIATAHTPLGAFSVIGFWGAMALLAKDSTTGHWDFSAAPVVGGGFSYRAFLSLRLFFQIGFSKRYPLINNLTLGDYRVKIFSNSTVELGYYFPEAGMWLGRKL